MLYDIYHICGISAGDVESKYLDYSHLHSWTVILSLGSARSLDPILRDLVSSPASVGILRRQIVGIPFLGNLFWESSPVTSKSGIRWRWAK